MRRKSEGVKEKFEMSPHKTRLQYLYLPLLLVLYHISYCCALEEVDATIQQEIDNASSDTIIITTETTLLPNPNNEDVTVENDFVLQPPEYDCISKPLLNGKISTCKTYQIATLNASPQRCLHIETPKMRKTHESKEETEESANPPTMICSDIPNWFDGTNGCDAYTKNKNWCELYGDYVYKDYNPLKANQACCVCGGGVYKPARFQVGDYVKVKKSIYKGLASCSNDGHVKIVKVQPSPNVAYLVEVQKMCGPSKGYFMRTSKGVEEARKYKKGYKFDVKNDIPEEIETYVKVELRKCRKGVREQEFEFLQGTTLVDGNTKEEMFHINHVLMKLELSSALGLHNPQMKIKQIFDDDLYLGSGDYFFILSLTERNEEKDYLVSGAFGITEFSAATLLSRKENRFAHETPHTMWQFKEVEATNYNEPCTETNCSIDEHVKWIEQMTRRIGIDYLEELAPWHLLDVEREASKAEVKARFRELSRSFHPDKVHPVKQDLYAKIFMLLQHAYDGLKGTDEAQKEDFRFNADTNSQLFAHSQYVIELLPFHWIKLEDDRDSGCCGEKKEHPYRLNASYHLHVNQTLASTFAEVSEHPQEQIWVIFLYSSSCGMSRSIVGFVDLAARHLKKYDNIKIGAYACGQYKDHEKEVKDPLGLNSDPICKQFQRKETPNVHVIVETVNISEEAETILPQILKENSKFKYFYSSVPYGNITEFYPHNVIRFAQTGKRVWNDSKLVNRMVKKDFASEAFLSNYSLVAFTDGTGNGDVDQEIENTITTSIPEIARRFAKSGLYVGTASCGYGEDVIDQEMETIDCSQLDVAWLPDIKLYGHGDMKGRSLLRGKFGDRRDVQIGADEDQYDDFEELDAESDEIHPTPSCSDDFTNEFESGVDLHSIDGFVEKKELGGSIFPPTDHEEEGVKNTLSNGPLKPKLASLDNEQDSKNNRIGIEKSRIQHDRVVQFAARKPQKVGTGTMLGGGRANGNIGAISG